MVSEPNQLTPREAWRRYIQSRRTELTDSSIQTYDYRLKLFTEWCEAEGIQTVGELDGWIIEQYRSHRAGQGLAASTLHNEMETLQDFARFLERIEAVDDGLSQSVDVPDVPTDERSRDTKLQTSDALALIQFYRSDETYYGTRFHALLEVLWHTGCRVGGVRALDLRDFDREDGSVEFVHRPETGTPLKKKKNGERIVALRDPVVDALAAYIADYRHDTHDEFGRSPLFTSSHGGRPQTGTFRIWCYQATQPCLYRDCPHGHERQTCEFTGHTHASKCPSSRAPHHVRTGAMTWMQDRGLPKEVVSERTNASPEIVAEYYDKATARERMELRRRPHLDKLSIDE